MTLAKRLAMFLPMLIACSSTANAELRPRYEDPTVVERAELIVVGHLKEDSIKYVSHKRKRQEGISWEHHASLVITEVIKGTCHKKDTMIIIHYGLDPRVGGISCGHGFRPQEQKGRKHAPTGPIYILDTGNSSFSCEPLLKDAREDNLWFLRKRTDRWGKEHSNTQMLGIIDPQDIQPLSLKSYFLAYLAEDPEAAVRQQLKKNVAIAERAQRYLVHLKIQRILRIRNPKTRVVKLLPYFIDSFQWGMKREPRDGLVACGDAACPELIKLFEETDQDLLRRKGLKDGPGSEPRLATPHLNALYENTKRKLQKEWKDQGLDLDSGELASYIEGAKVSLRDFLRRRIIHLLGEIRCESAVPFLIDLLNKHNEHWKQQMAKPDWESKHAYKSGANRRAYSETYAAVYAFLRIGDPRTRSVIEETQRRWNAINSKNPQILETCEGALKVLSAGEKEDSSAQQNAPADAQ